MVFPQILGVIESGIGPVCRQQLLMGALLGDAAIPDHQDAVGGPDGGEPVGDDVGGAAPAQLVKGVLIFASVMLSRAEVASSKIRMGGSFRKIRAMATRCFCPPESRVPRSPT